MIVDTYTETKGEVNEKLFARAIAVNELMSGGVKFDGSPTNSELCQALNLSNKPIGKKRASSLLLQWASSKQHK